MNKSAEKLSWKSDGIIWKNKNQKVNIRLVLK